MTEEVKIHYCGAGIYEITKGNDVWAVPASALMPPRENHKRIHLGNERLTPLDECIEHLHKTAQLNQETINSLNIPHEDYTEYKM